MTPCGSRSDHELVYRLTRSIGCRCGPIILDFARISEELPEAGPVFRHLVTFDGGKLQPLGLAEFPYQAHSNP
jgi:hypothetical protein